MASDRPFQPQGPVGRFAPSPSADLHLGSLRTALAAWLRARSRGHGFVLRIEDLDPDRSRERFVDAHRRDLALIGIDWDAEAPRQSQRADRYREAIDGLAARDLVYPCYCTRAEIREAASAPHGPAPEGAYPGTCAQLDAAGRRLREREGRAASLRLRAGAAQVTITDELYGVQSLVVDDFVVQRKDGVAAYNLAVVVDDADQQVAEVVRGRDLLLSAPRQAYLASLLGLHPVAWMHVPLVLGADGARLAKRHGSVSLADRMASGQTPESLRAELAASLGMGEPDELAECAPAELVARFDAARIPLRDWRMSEDGQ